jgi:hypothetical protein
MVHEGNVYFEHCYAADFEPKRSPAQRESCWTAWLAHYTKNQAAHRIDYAMRRVESLQSGERSPGLPDLAGPQQEAPMIGGEGAEVTRTGPRAGAEVATTIVAGEGAVLNGCEPACTATFSACAEHCPKESEGCPAFCEREKTICLGGCY